MRHLIGICMTALVVHVIASTAAGKELTGMDAVRLMDEGKVSEAIQAFEKLAGKGDDKAMVQLGILYYQGTGVQPDYSKAMDWFLQAFAKNNADAFVNLGVMHRDGQAVPKNKKIAYCVFLTTHMCELGSESTQSRSNDCLRRLAEELSKEDIKDCLTNYTRGYIKAYLEAKGKMRGIPDKYKPSDESPALKDLDWWLDGELDALLGPPTADEKATRQKRDAQREKEFDALQHRLVFQMRFAQDTADQYQAYGMITDNGMSSTRISTQDLQKAEGQTVCEGRKWIYAEKHRYITLETKDGVTLVYAIALPVKPVPRDWGAWQKPVFLLKDGTDTFTLLRGGEPGSKSVNVPKDAPELRFKVVKK